MKRTTIKNVATHAGVSTATVSRVLSNEPSVASGIAEKVRASAEQLNYRPNILARSLTNSQTNLIALVVGRLHNPFDAQLVESLSRHLQTIGQRLLVVPADYGENDPATMVALDYHVGGIIVAAGHLSKLSAERFAQLGVPVIVYGRTLDAPGVDCIVADNLVASRQVGELFRRHGVTRSLYVRHHRDTFSDEERGRGFREGLGEDVVVNVLECSRATARESALRALSGPTPPQGVYCANDVLAFGVIEAAVQLGFRIPENIMIIGFDDVDMAASPFFALTTLRQVPFDISEWIVTRLAERLKNPALAVTVHRMPAQLVLRGSTPDSNRIGGITALPTSQQDRP